MSDKPTFSSVFSPKKLVFLTLGTILAVGFLVWDRGESGVAINTVADELGLQFESNGRRHTATGNVDGVGITIKITFENFTGDTLVYTDMILQVPGSPPGTIVAHNLRQKIIDSVSGAEAVATGDEDFDRSVALFGAPDQLLAHFDAEARVAVQAAVDVGWSVEDGGPWIARERGYMGSVKRLRQHLELGLAAARAARLEGTWQAGLERIAQSDPSPQVRASAAAAASGVAVSAAQQSGLDAALNDPERAFDAAVQLAKRGDDRLAVQQVLLQGIRSSDRWREAVQALGLVGSDLEIAMLRFETGEHQEAAQAAIAAIEDRLARQ